MQHTHKQIMVMFFSVLFMVTIGIIVLSSTAAAHESYEDYQDWRDEKMAEDAISNNAHRIKELENELLYQDDSAPTTNNSGYKVAFWFLLVVIIWFVAVRHSNKTAVPDYSVKEDYDDDTPDTEGIRLTPEETHDIDTEDYDDEIDDGWTYNNERNMWIEDKPDPDIQDWINELDEHDRRAVLEEIEREYKR